MATGTAPSWPQEPVSVLIPCGENFPQTGSAHADDARRKGTPGTYVMPANQRHPREPNNQTPGGAKRIFRAVKLLCMRLQQWMLVITHLTKTRAHATPRGNPGGDYGLWVTMTCQCRFMDCHKGQSSVGVTVMGRGYWELSLSPQFCCAPNTVLKNNDNDIDTNTTNDYRWIPKAQKRKLFKEKSLL